MLTKKRESNTLVKSCP